MDNITIAPPNHESSLIEIMGSCIAKVKEDKKTYEGKEMNSIERTSVIASVLYFYIASSMWQLCVFPIEGVNSNRKSSEERVKQADEHAGPLDFDEIIEEMQAMLNEIQKAEEESKNHIRKEWP